MTIKYFLATLLVTILLAIAQIFVKLGLEKMDGFSLNLKTIISDLLSMISSGYLWLGVLSIIASGVLWMKVLSKVNLSIAYPMISMSYIFGLLAARLIFGESISLIRWLGVCIIMIGVILVMKG